MNPHDKKNEADTPTKSDSISGYFKKEGQIKLMTCPFIMVLTNFDQHKLNLDF